MRLIDADHLLEEIAKLKERPWFNDGKLKMDPMVCFPHVLYVNRKDAVEMIEDLCIKQEPTVESTNCIRWIKCKRCGCEFQNYMGIQDEYGEYHKIKEKKCPSCGKEVEE